MPRTGDTPDLCGSAHPQGKVCKGYNSQKEEMASWYYKITAQGLHNSTLVPQEVYKKESYSDVLLRP